MGIVELFPEPGRDQPVPAVTQPAAAPREDHAVAARRVAIQLGLELVASAAAQPFPAPAPAGAGAPDVVRPPEPPVGQDRQRATPGSPANGFDVGAPAPAAPSAVTVEAVLAGLPFAYLSGPAGTGKTTLAREILQVRDDAILCATTGIAAVNLGDASTINSLLGYFDTADLMGKYASGFLQMRLRSLRRSGIRLLILDEVSMLDGDQLTVLCEAFDEIDQSLEYDRALGEVKSEVKDADRRMQLLLVGDFAQLPPVEAGFAFESPAWKRFTQHTLSEVRRQGDHNFVKALHAVRQGRAAEALSVLEPRMVPTIDVYWKGTTIVAKNVEVDRVNNLRHAQLAGPEFTWKTLRAGEQEKEWIEKIPQQLTLKKGALVMILANKPRPKLDADDLFSGLLYSNGDLATVIAQEPQGCRVMLHRTFEEVVVTFNVKEWKVPTGKKNPRWEIKGSVAYMPLRLAYAVTVHKSQGLTLDSVQVGIADWMFQKPGMLYVALSRCRSLEGLRIVGTPKMFAGRCSVEPKIKEFL